MKRIITIMLAIILCVSVLSGCKDPGGKSLTVCSGYVVKTDGAYFFVSDGEDELLKKDDLVLMKTTAADVSFDALKNGDIVNIKIKTVEETQPLQADVKSLELVMHGGIGVVSDEIMYALEGLDYELDAELKHKLRRAKGTRIWDGNHPDDADKISHFSFTVPGFDNLTVKRDGDGDIYVNDERIIGVMPHGCDSFYISDLTGDGYPELCFGEFFGSGVTDCYIEIIDYTTATTIFTLRDRARHDYYFFLRDGFLCVGETKGMKFRGETTRTGVVCYNASGVTVVWDSEINTEFDRDTKLPDETVS